MPYLFAAFSVVWIVIFLYALSISRRQQELSREVETLRRMTEERDENRIVVRSSSLAAFCFGSIPACTGEPRRT